MSCPNDVLEGTSVYYLPKVVMKYGTRINENLDTLCKLEIHTLY